MKKCKIEKCEKRHYARGYCQKHYDQIRLYGEIGKRTIYTPNEIFIKDDYAEVILYTGGSNPVERARTIIDLDDVEKIKPYKWGWCCGYARCTKEKIGLHEFIVGREKDKEIDHINGDKLDNRKNNLRLVTHQQNSMNMKGRGYHFEKAMKKWKAKITHKGKVIKLGFFEKEEDAKKARLEAEKKYFGEYRRIKQST